MQNIKANVVSALKTATALYTLIADRVYFQFPNDFKTLPCISYFEYNNSGEFFCDDVEVGSEILYQIDVWSESSTSAIAQAVDTIMVAEGFVRLKASDRYEPSTAIHQKSMLYVNHYIDPN